MRRQKRSTEEPTRSRRDQIDWIKRQVRAGKIDPTEADLQLQALGADVQRGHPLRSNHLSVGMQDYLISARALGWAVTPLDYMICTLVHPDSSKEDRQWAAQTAAPYMHRRMPLAVEGGDPSKPIRIATAEQLRTLTPEEFDQLTRLSSKLVGETPDPQQVMKRIGAAIYEHEMEVDGH